MPLTARCVRNINTHLFHTFFSHQSWRFLSLLLGNSLTFLSPHLGVYYWSWQKAKAVPALPSHHRTQFWWDLEGGGLAPAHSREASSHTCRLEGMPCIWKWPQLLPVITAAEGTDNSYRTWAAAVLTSRLFCNVSLPPAWKLRDGSPEYVWRRGRLFVPSWRLHQRPPLWQKVPALHTPAISTGRKDADIQRLHLLCGLHCPLHGQRTHLVDRHPSCE